MSPRVIPEIERHYSPDEIGVLLSVHPRTVVRWCRSGRLCRARRIGRSSYRVPASAVAAFLECSTVP
jgi:excisionase family DNA binding protein